MNSLRYRTAGCLAAVLTALAFSQALALRAPDAPPAHPTPQPPPPDINTVDPIVASPSNRSALMAATGVSGSYENRLLAYLRRSPALLKAAQLPDLKTGYVLVIPAAGNVRARGYANFVQTVNGVEVVDAAVTLSFDPEASDLAPEVTAVHLYSNIPAPAAAPMTMSQAMSRVRANVSAQELRPLDTRIRWIDGRWRLVQEFLIEETGLSAAVDSEGRTYTWDERRYATYSGKVEGRGVKFDPVATGNSLPVLPLADLKIADGLGPVAYTSAFGQYSFSTPSAGDVIVPLSGRWVDVRDRNLTDLKLRILAGSPSPANLLFNPSGNKETDTAQVSAFVHTTAVHNWLGARISLPSAMSTPIPANVNINATCNAYYDGISINFYKSGGSIEGSCVNTAFDTVVYHEYGHYVDDLFGGIGASNNASGLSEGWGDVLAAFVSGQPIIGEGFFGNSSVGIRTAENGYRYAPDDFGNNEPHILGQAWAGFAWELRKRLIARYGAGPGAALAENLVIPVFAANTQDIPSSVLEVARRDDNDNDLNNGTPNIIDIRAAAALHGMGYVLAPDAVPPTAPDQLTVYSISGSTLTAYWSQGTDNQAIADYLLYVSQTETFTSHVPGYEGKPVGTERSYDIGGLEPNTKYYVRLKAKDYAGNVSTGFSPVASATTRQPDEKIPPSLSILQPASGAELHGDVLIRVSAQDDTGVAYVYFYTESGYIGLTTQSSGGVFQYNWSTDTQVDGEANLTAVAVDYKNNAAFATVRVKLNNGPRVRDAIDAGGGTYTTTSGVKYRDDHFYTDGAMYTTYLPVDGTPDQALYQSERFGDFKYDIPLDNGNYRVTLKFAEIYYTAPGQGVFDVFMENQKVIADLDVFAKAGPRRAYDEVLTTAVTDGMLNLHFFPTAGVAEVKAILIEPVESNPQVPQALGSIKSPKDGAVVSGVVTIEALAAQNSTIEFYVDDRLEHTTTGATPSYTWNTSGIAEGLHRLRIHVQEPGGGVADDSVTVRFRSGESPIPGQTGVEVSMDLTHVRAFPNPWRAGRGWQEQIKIDGLSAGSVVKIFTMSGRYVADAPVSGNEAIWNLQNADSTPVASGLYLYLIKDAEGRKATGKFAVIR